MPPQSNVQALALPEEERKPLPTVRYIVEETVTKRRGFSCRSFFDGSLGLASSRSVFVIVVIPCSHGGDHGSDRLRMVASISWLVK